MRTERLLLRHWQPDNRADVVAALALYSNQQVLRWLGAEPQLGASEETAKEWLEGWAAMDDGIRGLWAIVEQNIDGSEKGSPIGSAILANLPTSDGTPSQATQIAWHLHPEVWGRGYATEAMVAVINRARVAGITEIHALVFPENLASLRLCDRLGMKRLGTTSEWDNVEAIDHLLVL